MNKQISLLFLSGFMCLLCCSFCPKCIAQADLNAAGSFYGTWNGKISFKAFSVTQEMNIQIKESKYPDFVTVIVVHAKENNIKNDTVQCGFKNGLVKLGFNAKSLSNENKFCTGFLNLALLDEETMNGSFEANQTGCTAVDYTASKMKKETKQQTEANASRNYSNKVVGAGSDTQKKPVSPAATQKADKDCGKGMITRKSKKLIEVKATNGKILKLEVSHDGEQTIDYALIGCIEEMNMLLFEVTLYETVEYMVVGKADAIPHNLAAAPILSPNKKRLICSTGGDESGYQDNRIEIWRYDNGKLTKEYELKDMKWGPIDPAWKDNETVTMGVMNHSEGRIEKDKQKILRFTNNKWTLK